MIRKSQRIEKFLNRHVKLQLESISVKFKTKKIPIDKVMKENKEL